MSVDVGGSQRVLAGFGGSGMASCRRCRQVLADVDGSVVIITIKGTLLS